MTQIKMQIDNIVYGLKRLDALKDVRFVREYGLQNVETPISGIVAAVCIKSTKLSESYIGGFAAPSVRGDVYSAEVQIKVYAPATENGNGLSELVSEMLTGLKKADEQNIITEASASSIEFDPNLNAIYRKVEFGVSFCLCEEVVDE